MTTTPTQDAAKADLRQRYTAEYFFPGILFPETATKDIEAPTVGAAVAAQTSSQWYAVKIRTVFEKRFVAPLDGAETWVHERSALDDFVVIGEKVHANDIEPTDENRILISNIECNSEDGVGVKTRTGNWQIAEDYDRVLTPAELDAEPVEMPKGSWQTPGLKVKPRRWEK